LKKDGKNAYEAAREFYLAALEAEPQNHWVISQYLSIMATPVLANDLAFKALSINHGAWWIAARQIAQWQLNETVGENRVWALATLAELALLGMAYGGKGYGHKQAKEEITRHCLELKALLGPDAFAIFSTQRQFKRYLKHWKRGEWQDLAHAALEALGDKPFEESPKGP